MKNLANAVAGEAGERMDHFRWVARDKALAALEDAHTRAGVEDRLLGWRTGTLLMSVGWIPLAIWTNVLIARL